MNRKTRSGSQNKIQKTGSTSQKTVENNKEAGEYVNEGKDIGAKLRIRPLDLNTKLNIYYDEPEEIDGGYFIHGDGLARQRKPMDEKYNGVVLIPTCRIVDTEVKSDEKWRRPNRYIKHKNSSSDYVIKNNLIEYDVDSDDENLIECINNNLDNKKKKINETDFETYIDYFEKEYASEKDENNLPFQTILQRFKRGTCEICADYVETEIPEGDDKGIKCQSCEKFIHFRCYRKIDSENWTCDKCTEKAVDVQCDFCGGSKGFICKNEDGIWSHIFCRSKSLPLTSKSNRKSRSLILPTKDCILCHKNTGYCIECSVNYCHNSFHPRCAHIYGLYIENTNRKLRYYCRKHSPIEPLNIILLRTPLTQSEINTVKKSVSRSKKLKKIDDHVLQLLYSYWILKRYIYDRELIFRLYMLSENSRRLDEQKENLNKMEMKMSNFLKLRQHLERLRLLADLCKKRENTKRQYIDNLANFLSLYKNNISEHNDRIHNLPNQQQRRKLRALESRIDGGKIFHMLK